MVDAFGARAPQIAALLVVSVDAPTRFTSYAAEVPYERDSRSVRLAQLPALLPWEQSARQARLSQEPALIVWTSGVFDVPRESHHFALVPWTATPPGLENRSRAWSFTLDGHLFYVLDLGVEGTFVFDMSTSQWSEFRTEGFDNWNMHVGTTWQAPNRVVAGDLLNGYVWEMSPSDLLDEEFRPIEHIVTGGVASRSRVYIGVEAVRIAASIGQVQDAETGILTKMRFSDDAGQNWSDDYVVQVIEGEFDGEIAYRSLGSFMAPGRVFEFSDLGGMLRIDGADMFLDDFDAEEALTNG